MHLLILADSLDDQVAGVHTYSRSLIKAITNQKFIQKHKLQISIICQKTKKIKGAKVYCLPDYNKLPFYTTWRQFFILPRLINKIDPDYCWDLVGFAPHFLNQKIKILTTVHDLTPLTHPRYHLLWPRLWFKLFLANSIHKSSYIFVPSDSTRKAVLDYVPGSANKVLTVPLATDFNGEEKVQKKLINKLNLNKYFLYIGTIEPRKNLEFLIRNFAIWSKQNPGIDLILAGQNGWLNQEIWQAVNEVNSSNIRYLGYVPRSYLPTLIQKSIALVYPSHAEGFGLPILEALKFGKLVLASEIPVHKEVAGDVAFYFGPEDAESLKSALDKAMGEVDTQSWLKRKLVANKFSWMRHVETVVKALAR